VQRLDAVTALWIALAVRAAVCRKPLAFGVWMGLATATKIIPALMVPALLAADAGFWLRDRRNIGNFALGLTAAFAFGFLPIFVLAPHALASLLAYHSQRGLHCESTLGLLLATARLVTGARTPATLSFGSLNLGGRAADALAAFCGPLSLAAALAVAWLARRNGTNAGASTGAESGPKRVACAAMATLVVLWLTGKVFSPQYMTWGLPLVLAVPGALGIRLAWVLAAAMALTQFYVCGHMELVEEGQALGLLNLAARDAVLFVAGYLTVKDLDSVSTSDTIGRTDLSLSTPARGRESS